MYFQLYRLTLKETGDVFGPLGKKFDSPRSLANICFEMDMHRNPEEYFYAFALDTKLHLLGVFEISHGTLDATIIHPRDVFKSLILMNASGVVLAHNHPSGDTSPSREDLSVTERLRDVGDLIGIDVKDHLIIGDRTYYSMKEAGLL